MPLEKAMARSLGYGDFTRREALERALDTLNNKDAPHDD